MAEHFDVSETLTTPVVETGITRLLIPMTLLYASYGLVLGFVQGGIGPVLVARGLPLELAGLTAVLFLPLGLAFLWSPFIERWHVAGMPAATGWIIAAQTVAAAVLVLIGFNEGAPLSLLLGLGLGVTTAMATMDVQFEGLVVRLVPEKFRSTVAAVKLTTFTLGAIAGGGFLVGLFERIGWTAAFALMAASLGVSVSSLAILPAKAIPAAPSPRLVLREIVGRPQFLRRLSATAFFLASLFLLFGLNRVALVDLGVPLERVGWVVGTLAPLLGLPAIALSGLLVLKIGSRKTLLLFVVAGAACGFAWAIAAAGNATLFAIAITIVGTSVLAGAYVILLGALLAWSVGERPATDYAIFYGLGNLAAMIPMAGAGALAAIIGWSVYFALAVVIFGVAGLWLYRHIAEAKSAIPAAPHISDERSPV